AALLFSIQEFYQNLFLGVLSTGVFFMFPLAVLTLHKIGLVSSETLSKQWRYVVFAIFAILAFITPDPTLVTDLVLGVPFMALYFLSIWLVKRSEKKGRKSG
ncbi:MAG: twin-arginine translocase subunit TatC, partial [Thermofilum sp.]